MAMYQQQLKAFDHLIDADFWRQPEGISIPGDPLKFLYIPDQVTSLIVAELARSIYNYQVDAAETGEQITQAVMITMGGLLPGVLLHDHLAWNPAPDIPSVEFGTFGVQYYAGPGQPLDAPRIVQDVTIDVHNQVVAVIEDLVDLGGTARFVSRHLMSRGARKTILVAPYLKRTDVMDEMRVIFFGYVPPHTWIIMPRERVETLIKRVPYWRENGASLAQCHEYLLKIGYPQYLINLYLEEVYAQSVNHNA